MILYRAPPVINEEPKEKQVPQYPLTAVPPWLLETPTLLRPDIVGMRGPMVSRLRLCMK